MKYIKKRKMQVDLNMFVLCNMKTQLDDITAEISTRKIPYKWI
jgi:uncharacterized protein YejL (UPF0352 family)